MNGLRDVLSAHHALYAVVTDPCGSHWEEYGEKSAVPYQGIISAYFPNPDAMAKLDEFLQGQMLPKTIVQGDVICVISRPREDRIVGVFLLEKGDVIARMRRGRTVDADIKAATGTES